MDIVDTSWHTDQSGAILVGIPDIHDAQDRPNAKERAGIIAAEPRQVDEENTARKRSLCAVS